MLAASPPRPAPHPETARSRHTLGHDPSGGQRRLDFQHDQVILARPQPSGTGWGSTARTAPGLAARRPAPPEREGWHRVPDNTWLGPPPGPAGRDQLTPKYFRYLGRRRHWRVRMTPGGICVPRPARALSSSPRERALRQASPGGGTARHPAPLYGRVPLAVSGPSEPSPASAARRHLPASHRLAQPRRIQRRYRAPAGAAAAAARPCGQ